MEQNTKSKPVTTSVPSISIKFHANAEEIEEFYGSEDEIDNSLGKLQEKSGSGYGSNIGESDASPLKFLPKLGKRSTSIDVSPSALDHSPPSDPWRFFSDIKGKITKSVEEKITEIKSRNQEEGSPLHKTHKSDTKSEKSVKESKESSSVSDSEELSESSISRTCGVISTTEGVEMSSEEETPYLDKEKKQMSPKTTFSLRRRFKLFRSKTAKEGTIKINSLSKLYNINTEKVEQALPEQSEEVESAVDALEDFKDVIEETVSEKIVIDHDNIIRSVEKKYDNIEINEDVINVKEVTGNDIRQSFFGNENSNLTVFAPTGFVDLRPTYIQKRPTNDYSPWFVILVSISTYIFLHMYNSYSAGFLAGIALTVFVMRIYVKYCVPNYDTKNMATMVPSTISMAATQHQRIMEIEAIKEYQPIIKHEGWTNEYPDHYNADTYHISHTQSVFLRLQGNLLRISHSKCKIPKRAMWNENKIKTSFTHHRIYNLLDAKISLLPSGLAKKRLWSKKYPICITLSQDQLDYVKLDLDDDSIMPKEKSVTPKMKKKFAFKKKDYSSMCQQFSKLSDGYDFDLDSDSRASTPSPENSDTPLEDVAPTLQELNIQDDLFKPVGPEKLLTNNKNKDGEKDVNIYIFGRTDREKEDWFRRFVVATHTNMSNGNQGDGELQFNSDFLDNIKLQEEYAKYMMIFKQPFRKSSKLEKHHKESEKSKKDRTRRDSEKENETNNDSDNNCDETDAQETKCDEVMWLNALIGRVLFDCVRDPNFTLKVKDRIQRKLGAIKLPYFIEELLVTEMSLGKNPPLIHRTTKPVMDDRGLWVDLDITYEGLIVLTLQTKINLMKLKNPNVHEKPMSEIRSAIYHSDVDDSAESSSDNEGPQELQLLQDGSATANTGSSSNSGKKIIKMVDRIAESKFFQAATENRYIKKAMEGVSNTDLRLTVELRALAGTMVINIPQPPSDRLWIGFRPVPELVLSARPIVGERNINYIMVTSWIEKKLVQEFQKILVIPNMDDFVIPIMNPKLPN